MRACLIALLLSGAALAQTPAAAPDVDTPSRTMKPLNIDLRGTFSTDVLLIAFDLGAAADVGLLPAGPGTLSVGAELDYSFCGSFCWLLSGLTGFNWGVSWYSPFARLAYHFPVKNQPTLQKADLYGLFMLGLVGSTAYVESKDKSLSVVGTDTSFGFGLGAGGNYFVGDHLYVGLEARYRYARGRYDWVFKAGNYEFKDSESTWSLSGINILVFLGFRL
jgi:hypothetical protein